MRSFTGTVLVASWAALLLASTTPARATPESLGSVHVGVSGGYGWLSKDLDLSGRRGLPATVGPGPLGGVSLGVGLGRFVSVEVGVWALPSKLRGVPGDALSLASAGELVLHALEGPVSLSWSVGAGALSLVSGELGRESDLLLTASMGARYLFAARRLAARLDVRVWFTDGVDGAVSVSPVLTAGLDVYLRRSRRAAALAAPSAAAAPDRDGDGLPDADDRCPDRRGATLLSGCPDGDEDGVADMDDGCPEHAGAAALGGCPDVDGDGVADPQDACPTLPGEARFSGCTDRDGDGVADADDRCPAAAGPVERAGCPEPPARDLRRLEGPVPGLRFARGSARLLPGSDRAIEEVAKLLVAWPDLVLVVEGHTARQGSRDAALTLSEARAEVVALRLVALGVAARRITSVGRGFDAPIASNKTGAGRARNERIELRVSGQ